jgi:tRNA nucleotidyltransferase (CCA-adding enzyme)
LGADAKIALRLSVLLGISEESILPFADDSTPCSIKELAIGGEDIIALGYGGKEIGAALAFLLDEVIRDPSLNTRERLLSLLRTREERRKDLT